MKPCNPRGMCFFWDELSMEIKMRDHEQQRESKQVDEGECGLQIWFSLSFTRCDRRHFATSASTPPFYLLSAQHGSL
jgi:hypothetical protein